MFGTFGRFCGALRCGWGFTTASATETDVRARYTTRASDAVYGCMMGQVENNQFRATDTHHNAE